MATVALEIVLERRFITALNRLVKTIKETRTRQTATLTQMQSWLPWRTASHLWTP